MTKPPVAAKPESEFYPDGMARFERGVGLVVKAATREKASRPPARRVKKSKAKKNV